MMSNTMDHENQIDITDPSFGYGTTNQALCRVRSCLNYSLKNNYGIDDPETTEKFLRMHGLSKDHFDFINNFENLIEKGISDNSVDTNANKQEISINGLFNEVAMPIKKITGYRYLYRKMKDMYGKKRAKYLSGLMYDMSLALADSTNILSPYCWSLNASKLVIEGRQWGSLYSLPPKRLSSYLSCLAEVIHQLSNHLAGAIAIGSFFLDLAHMYIYRDGRTLSELKNNRSLRKDIENSLQSFIHSMNHLSRNSVESPFTNISIMDPVKLRALVADDNMGWYFEKDDALDGRPEKALEDCGDSEWKEYVIDIILELEDIYMNIMDEGDKCHDGRPITFPVSTVNISRRRNDEGKYELEDRDFVDHVCSNHDIMRYNIYVSEGNKLASCCFTGDQVFTYIDEGGKTAITTFEDFAKRYLNGEGPEEAHIEEGKYVKDPENGEVVPITGVIRMENQFNRIIDIELEDGSVIKATPNQKFYDNNSGNMVTAQEIMENPERYDI